MGQDKPVDSQDKYDIESLGSPREDDAAAFPATESSTEKDVSPEKVKLVLMCLFISLLLTIVCVVLLLVLEQENRGCFQTKFLSTACGCGQGQYCCCN